MAERAEAYEQYSMKNCCFGVVVYMQERSRRLEIRREAERKRREKEQADIEARRLEAEERSRLKVREVAVRVCRLFPPSHIK